MKLQPKHTNTVNLLTLKKALAIQFVFLKRSNKTI